MAKFVFNDFYNRRPKSVCTKLDTDTVFVSQSEVKTSGLAYQLARYGMNTLEARMEQMRSKFGYADCTKNNNFADIQNRYVQSVEYFNALPSEVRRKYHDRPEDFYNSIEKDPELAYKTGFISEEQYKSMVETIPVQNSGINENETVITDTPNPQTDEGSA